VTTLIEAAEETRVKKVGQRFSIYPNAIDFNAL